MINETCLYGKEYDDVVPLEDQQLLFLTNDYIILLYIYTVFCDILRVKWVNKV